MHHRSCFYRALPRTLALAVVLGAIAPAMAGEPIKRVDPVYPPDAARAGKTGYVELEYSVDAGGKVANVSVVDAKPSHTFETAAVKAVKQWQFAPGESRGKVRLDFKL